MPLNLRVQQFFKPSLLMREPAHMITESGMNFANPIARVVSSGGSIGQKEHIKPVTIDKALVIPSMSSIKALTPDIVSSAFKKTDQIAFASAVATKKMEI